MRLVIAALAALVATATGAAEPAPGPLRIYTNERYVEDVTRTLGPDVTDMHAMFALVLGSLPQRVKVYPTENYYYFSFYLRGLRYAGNIRLDPVGRDEGKVHFAYSVDFAEWKAEDPAYYAVLDRSHGVLVEKLEPLVYRVSYAGRVVVFELNDLSRVMPPTGLLGPDERYIGPIFDESAIRFFLIYNHRLKLFHYVLDETVPVADVFDPAQTTDRILIGKRTGFAFYRDHRLERKILIGVFEGNARSNNYFDGPFDQLPDNFMDGESLRSAILEVEPSLAGQIDRFGASADGETRFMIAPYAHYRVEEDLLQFHECATSKTVPAASYYACFALDHRMESQTPRPPLKKKPARVKKQKTQSTKRR